MGANERNEPGLERIGEPHKSEFLWLAKGCFVDCYASNDHVLKVFVPSQTVARRYADMGIHLGRVSWSLAPGNPLKAAHLHRKRALGSAERCCREFPELAAIVDWNTDEAATVPFATGPKRSVKTGPWVLQRRARTYREILRERPESEALASLRRVVELAKELEAHKASARVCNFLDNWGEVGGEPRFLDIGDFDFDLEAGLAGETLERLRGQDSFRELKRSHPALAAHLESLIDDATHHSPQGPNPCYAQTLTAEELSESLFARQDS